MKKEVFDSKMAKLEATIFWTESFYIMMSLDVISEFLSRRFKEIVRTFRIIQKVGNIDSSGERHLPCNLQMLTRSV